MLTTPRMWQTSDIGSIRNSNTEWQVKFVIWQIRIESGMKK